MKNFLYFSSKSFNTSSHFAVSKFSTKCTALSDSKFCIIFFIFIGFSKANTSFCNSSVNSTIIFGLISKYSKLNNTSLICSDKFDITSALSDGCSLFNSLFI